LQRLERDPSLMADARSAAIHAMVPLFITAVAWIGFSGWLAPDPAPATGTWEWVVLAILGLFSFGFVARFADRLRRAVRGQAPTVEVDAQPWQPGAAGRVRIADPDTRSLDALEVVLVADGVDITKVPLTTASDGAWRISSAVRHQLPLASLTRAQLQPRSIDRVIDFTVPHEAADQDWRWRVVVLGRKDKVRVPVREDSFPVRIEAGRPEHPIRP
jgi:hypothetical protein